MKPRHLGSNQTLAWPLMSAYLALVVYASLYPFHGWRDQGIAPWTFLWAPLPYYWSGFDVWTNVVAYLPLGFLTSLALHRFGMQSGAWGLPVLLAGLLTLCMEGLQVYLPSRVPSNVDCLLNLLGASIGVLICQLALRLGLLVRWSQWKKRWLAHGTEGAAALVLLWPVALLFPSSVPMALGQVGGRLQEAMVQILAETSLQTWVGHAAAGALQPLTKALVLALALCLPLLLAYATLRSTAQRVLALLLVPLLGTAVTCLSAALSYGPEQAWAWVSLPIQVGGVLGCVWAGLALFCSAQACRVLALVVVILQLSIINQADPGAYLEQTLQRWETGQFIRFYGASQWLSWLWPYAVLAYLVLKLSASGKVQMGGHR
jgi:VanZ family protein